MNNQPPKCHNQLFKWFCNEELYEELQGDLEEAFYRDAAAFGYRKARALYRRQVLTLIRPSVIRKPLKSQKLIMPSLFYLNLKLAMRNMARHKLFSAVNVLGLAAALCVSLFMVNIVYTCMSLDRQHADIDRIYRIASYVITPDKGRDLYASVPNLTAELLKEDIPDLDAVTHIKTGLIGTFKLSGDKVEVRGIKTDSAFFDIFNFEAISGNPLSIFSDINSIIITDEAARRYFPDTDPIGLQTEEGYVVKAVVATPKKKSHLQFEIIGQLESPGTNPAARTFEHDLSYNYNDYAYVRLSENSSAEVLTAKLAAFSDKINAMANLTRRDYNFISQRVKGIVFGDPGFNEPGLMIGSEGLAVYLVMIVIMLSIASFNYTNLSVARATQRTKEIGIRKVSGGSSRQIIGQILVETQVISFFALALGLSFYKFFADDFTTLIPFIDKAFQSGLNLEIIVLFTLFTLITGLLAGIFPALFFAKINPLSLFNPRVKSRKLSFLTVRKVLVTFQLTLSMFCVIFMVLLNEQVILLKNSPRGFETSSRYIVRADAANAPLLKSAFLQVSGVNAVSITSDIPGEIVSGGISFYDPIDNDTSLAAMAMWADESFDEVLTPRLLDGRYFQGDIVPGTQKEVLVNEPLLRLINTELSGAVGTVLKDSKNQFKIVGVLEDIANSNPFIKSEPPLMIIAARQETNQSILLVKMTTTGNESTLRGLEAAWQGLYPDDKFEPKTLTAQLNEPIREFENIIVVERFVAFAIIAIALLGQLGMALYNAETRVKEISIRKVLGAKMQSILRLLLLGTVVPILIGSLIAWPISHLLFTQGFAVAFRTPLQPGPWLYLQGILPLTGIILLLVLSQTWRVARLKPAESLRSE